MCDSDGLMQMMTCQAPVSLQVNDEPAATVLATDNVYVPTTPAPHPAPDDEVPGATVTFAMWETVGSPVHDSTSFHVVEDAIPLALKVRAPAKTHSSPPPLSLCRTL